MNPELRFASVPQNAAGASSTPASTKASPQQRAPSRWEFLATAYRFPLWRSAIGCWLLLSLGLTPGLTLLASAFDWSGGSWFAVEFGWILLSLPLVILSLWTAAYGAALFNAIFDATAGGAGVVDDWPDYDWADWLGHLLHLAYVTGIAAFVGYLASIVCGAARSIDVSDPGTDWPILILASAGTIFLVFPFVFLSTQFAASPWSPVAPVVVRSVFRSRAAVAWLLFYVAAAPLPVVLWAQIAFSKPGHVSLAAAGLGPQLAAAWMIYARLLGRLAWEISQACIETEAQSDSELAEGPTAGSSATPG
ncbi:MAG: hypothetical protein ACT4QC_11275 [Planctomycetaceae bacterium]